MAQNLRASTAKASSFVRSVRLVRRICQIAGARSIVDDSRVGLAQHGAIAAVQRYDTAAIVDWLVDALSDRGVSDGIAYGYMEQHCRVRWHDIASALAAEPSCPKLKCYWAFEGC